MGTARRAALATGRAVGPLVVGDVNSVSGHQSGHWYSHFFA